MCVVTRDGRKIFQIGLTKWLSSDLIACGGEVGDIKSELFQKLLIE